MRQLFIAILSVMSIGSPLSASAHEQESLHAQPLSIAFDEVDDATLQAEVSKQAHAFLQTIEAHWGDSQARLRAVLSGDIREDERGMLISLRNLSDHGVLEGYEFWRGSLVRGQYVLLQRPLNGLNEFIGYYQAIKLMVTEFYGAPVQDQILWNNDLYQPVPDYWGVAVMIGHLRYQAAWETEEGTLTLELTGEHHSKLSLEYRSRHEKAQA